jgi:hypothetical protein
MAQDPPGVLRLRSDTIWREADGEVLGLDHGLRNYVSANSAGSVLWKLLVEGATRDDLARALVAEYGIDAQRAASDVEVFLADLRANGFLEP